MVVNSYNKQIRQDIKFFISSLQLNEFYFYGFTINFPNYIDDKSMAISKIDDIKLKLVDILKSIDLIEFVYIAEETHGGRQQSREESENMNNKKLNKFLIEYEKTMVGLPHLHGIVGLRSIVKYNENIILNIIKYLRSFFSDVDLHELKTHVDVLKYWNYCIKENNFEKHVFINYSKFYATLYGMFYDKTLEFLVNNVKCLYMNYIPGKYDNIRGLLKLNSTSNYFILYIIAIYFEFKMYKIDDKNNVYMKNKDSLYSWVFIDNIDSFLRNNIINIFNELRTYFPFQLHNNNNVHLLFNDVNLVINLINTDIKILPHIIINYDVIEFKDGLYFLNCGYFYSLLHNQNKNLNCCCVKFYDKWYKLLRRKKPNFWLSLISKNFKTESDCVNFCTVLGYYFNCNTDLSTYKQKSMAIVGNSNTGKTTLIANPLLESVHLHNVGLISDMNEGFTFEDVMHKKLIICDEFKYIKSTRSSLLKLMDGDPLLINRKNIKKIKYINKAPIIFLFNDGQNGRLFEDSAFKNRLLIYTFTQTIVSSMNVDIKSKITEELPNIIIYCNNLFFNKNFSKNQVQFYRKQCRELLLKNIQGSVGLLSIQEKNKI